MASVVFLTEIHTLEHKRFIRILLASLRTFGGALAGSPFWVFEADPDNAPCEDLAGEAVRIIPLDTPPVLRAVDFGDKVYACACAEDLAPAGTETLAWIDPACLVVQPPRLYDLGGAVDAALRPVHIRNVGLRAADPLDDYWQRVYTAAGVADVALTVESFVDRQRLRAYFNTHAFAVNPGRGILRRWLACFIELIGDLGFQAGPCRAELHRIFLHQAIFSALIAAAVPPERLRILPPEYNYPYNLHASLPPERRARAFNDLITLTYENRTIDPAELADIAVDEPLRTWLVDHA